MKTLNIIPLYRETLSIGIYCINAPYFQMKWIFTANYEFISALTLFINDNKQIPNSNMVFFLLLCDNKRIFVHTCVYRITGLYFCI